jgi:hypothetical protein
MFVTGILVLSDSVVSLLSILQTTVKYGSVETLGNRFVTQKLTKTVLSVRRDFFTKCFESYMKLIVWPNEGVKNW